MVNPLLAEVDAAKKALDASPDDEALQAAYDEAASRLYDALPKGAPKAKWMLENGHDKSLWTYTKPEPANAGGRVGADAFADTPPAKYPDAKRGKDKAGNPIWAIIRDGKPYQVPG